MPRLILYLCVYTRHTKLIHNTDFNIAFYWEIGFEKHLYFHKIIVHASPSLRILRAVYSSTCPAAPITTSAVLTENITPIIVCGNSPR